MFIAVKNPQSEEILVNLDLVQTVLFNNDYSIVIHFESGKDLTIKKDAYPDDLREQLKTYNKD